ncbi:DUF4869 domain-containing protein [Treponema sp.]|uniref:DUF4869 domain-containing protein n=1 Tax=Treponema sp. TaxID=166 RepID=UPI0025E018D0|nr:DUF4869 domain-containing protein [Treponema sp.]MCR5219243.1 DUF4869 domain-containing protein [Treponema sp.]
MLNVTFGDMFDDKNYIYNTSLYFDNTFQDKWITSDFGKEIIKDIDKSKVISGHVIESPYLGAITPTDLSGGVKTLLLMAFDNSKVFNASTCGNNCAKWILKLGLKKKLVINLRHVMDFGHDDFKIKITNTGNIVHNMREFVAESFSGF